MGVYRPKFKAQWNDPTTTLDWFNCTMTSGAMGLDFDTLGHVDVMGGTLRSHSGDHVGGSNLAALEKAWAYYGQDLHVQTGGSWSDVTTDLHNYKGVILQGMYGALPKAYHSTVNSIGFTGAHAIYLNPEFNANGDVLMGDPLNNKFIWVPQAALHSFAAALGAHELGSSSRLFFAASDPHKPVVSDPVPYVHTVRITADPYVNIRETPSAGYAAVGNLNKGVTVKTTHLRRYGGRYIVGGQLRTDWLGFMHNGEEDWIARAYTTVVS